MLLKLRHSELILAAAFLLTTTSFTTIGPTLLVTSIVIDCYIKVFTKLLLHWSIISCPIREYLDYIIGGFIYATAIHTLVNHSCFITMPHYLLYPLFKRTVPILARNLTAAVSNEMFLFIYPQSPLIRNRSIFLDTSKSSFLFVIKSILEANGICIRGLQSTLISHFLSHVIINDLKSLSWNGIYTGIRYPRLIINLLWQKILLSQGYALSRCFSGDISAFIGNMINYKGLPWVECLLYGIGTKTFDVVVYGS